jgi:hypothetical protein
MKREGDIKGLPEETFAGCNGALAVLPVLLTLGLLAFSPLGVAAPPVALLVTFVTVGIGGLVRLGPASRRIYPAPVEDFLQPPGAGPAPGECHRRVRRSGTAAGWWRA